MGWEGLFGILQRLLWIRVLNLGKNGLTQNIEESWEYPKAYNYEQSSLWGDSGGDSANHYCLSLFPLGPPFSALHLLLLCDYSCDVILICSGLGNQISMSPRPLYEIISFVESSDLPDEWVCRRWPFTLLDLDTFWFLPVFFFTESLLLWLKCNFFFLKTSP